MRDHRRYRAVFTIVSANYIGFAATLMQSVAKHHPEVDRYIILSDAMHDFSDIDHDSVILSCDELEICNIENMKLWYTVIEFNTAIKPYAFQFMFDKGGYRELCYIDPDILLFQPLREVFWALRDHTCVLTPHMMQSLQDGKEPSDLTIMKSGVYNLGFLALKNDDDAQVLVKWWADRCFDGCRVDIAGNRFTDQRWMDLAPVFVSRPYILRHPGYNVAYWNLVHRTVTFSERQGWQVDGDPLVFFHFSGIKPDDPSIFSKHTNRFVSDNLGVVSQLCKHYRDLVLSNKWKKYSNTEYAFGRFANGRAIDDTMRHWICRVMEEGLIDKHNPIAINSEYFDDIDEFAIPKGVKITKYMYQFWLDRDDLRTTFDIFDADGLKRYFDWFLNDPDVRSKVDARSISAVKSLSVSQKSISSTKLAKATSPWLLVAEGCWNGHSKDVSEFLTGDVKAVITGIEVRVPVIAALLWELRPDLNQHFPLNSIDSLKNFLAWFITGGSQEMGLDLSLLSKEFVRDFTSVSEMSQFYGDVPLTEGMILTREINVSRAMPGWEKFPIERSSRIAHGYWFAMTAGRVFGWPSSLNEEVRRYFTKKTNVYFDGYALNMGIIAIWEARRDLQATFPLASRNGIAQYLSWLLKFGLKELSVSLVDLDPDFSSLMWGESPKYSGLSRIQELFYDDRHDLKMAFEVLNADGRRDYLNWLTGQLHLSLPDESGWQLSLLNQSKVESSHEGVTRQIDCVLTGQWQAASGRGEDIRCTAQALLSASFSNFIVFDCDLEAFFDPYGHPIRHASVTKTGVNIFHTNADSSLTMWSLAQRHSILAEKSIGYWAWELEKLPSYWRFAFGFYDEIWAATNFAFEAFKKENLRPVSIMPMAVTAPKIEEYSPRDRLGITEDETLFVFMFDFRSFIARKNPEAVIKAFDLAFGNAKEKVRLVIKSQGGASEPESWRWLNSIIRDSRVELRDVKMPRDALFSLIKSADGFISLHRSEGFGRAPAEAMLLGVPTIVTDYSGTCDFATQECSIPISYILVPVSEDEYPGVEGQCWADANIEEAATQMRWIYENRDKARELGLRGKQKIIDLFDAELIGWTLREKLGL